MQFITLTDNKLLTPCVATIGFFDGVHRGHRFLIDQVCHCAAEKGLPSLLITFRVHPRQVMQADFQPRLLSTPEEKFTLLAETGADYCAMLDFTPAMSELSAYEFMSGVLKQQLSVNTLIIGYDHHFGHGRKEGFPDYVRYGQMLGIDVIQAKGLTLGDVAVSSSVTRAFLSEGEVEMASRCLARPYALSGHVVSGFQEGRGMGFPTANIMVDNAQKLIPARGAYAVRVTDESASGMRYVGMLNIGLRPTMKEKVEKETIEVHLLGYNGDLYGHLLKVEFIERLREEHKFRSKAELIRQLQADEARVESMRHKILEY